MTIQSKNFQPTGGVDLKSNDIVRQAPFLSGGINARYKGSDLIKRFGKKCIAGEVSPAVFSRVIGIYRFKGFDYAGNFKDEIIGIIGESSPAADGKGYPVRLVEDSFTITVDSNGPYTFSSYYSEAAGEFQFIAYDAVDAGVVGVNLGIGNGAGFGVSLDSLLTSISAHGDLTAATSSAHGASAAAAHIELINDKVVQTGDSLTVKFWRWELINSSKLNNYRKVQPPEIGNNEDEWTVPSAVMLNNVMFIAIAPESHSVQQDRRYDLCKYDGQNFYRAGVPVLDAADVDAANDIAPGIIQDALGSRTIAAAKPGTNYKYRLTVINIDKAGNVVEGYPSSEATDTGGAGNISRIDKVEAEFDKGSTSGYNDHFAVTSGNNVGTPSLTLNVQRSSGAATDHSLQVGDVAYFWDEGQGIFISRLITARTATTITISSDRIQVNDAGGSVQCFAFAYISANFRVGVWMQSPGSTDWTLVAEVPYPTEQVITPNEPLLYASTDTAYPGLKFDGTGARYIEPQFPYGHPPACSTVSRFQNLVMCSGIQDRPNTVVFMDAEHFESFPLATHAIDIDEKVTGHKESGGVFSIFGRTSISSVVGDFFNLAFRVEKVAETIGSINHHSIQQIEEGLLGFLSTKGPYYLANGRDIRPMGSWKDNNTTVLEPYFIDQYDQYSANGAELEYPSFEHSTAAFWERYKLYILHIPWVTKSAKSIGTDFSDTWVFDHSRQVWLPVWKGLNFEYGVTEFNNQIWGSGRAVPLNSTETNMVHLVDDKGIYNYGDHEDVLESYVLTHWEHLGEPNLFKKFLRLMISMVGTNESPTWDMLIRTYVNFDQVNPHTIANVQNLTNTDKKTRIKLKSGKFNALMIEFYNALRYQTFLVSGWNTEIAPTHRQIKGSAFRGDQ